jgi:hypothetical protein
LGANRYPEKCSKIIAGPTYENTPENFIEIVPNVVAHATCDLYNILEINLLQK